ncbi:MAG: hypothetical protein ACFFH0_06650 [Promethearchaeota archaeon]
MLVVEDTTTNEIRRFYILDAMLQLGVVQAGTQSAVFDPARAVSYYGMVESRLYDYSLKYPEAFGFLPRRAYEHLKKPPLMSELYQDSSTTTDSEWFVDAFIVRPLFGISETHLPVGQQTDNITFVEELAMTPPFSSRLYRTQDMRHGHRSDSGWACNLMASDLENSLKGANRTDLIWYLKSGLPIFVELEEMSDLDSVVKWVVFLKEAGMGLPSLVFSAKNHKEWGNDIVRILDIPHSRVLTAGATISSITTISKYLQKVTTDSPWSSRLVFASSYPETQVGDSISELLSLLLSKSFGADADDIQRILGGNMLSMLPTRPPYLQYVMNNSTVVAEGLLGKASLGEFARVLRILAARRLQIVESFDYMLSREGGVVHFDDAVMTVRDPREMSGNAIALLRERDGSFRVSGWRQTFTETITKRRADLFSTLVRAATGSEGPILDSPSHLNRFNYALLDCLKVRNPQEILSALHFTVQVAEGPRGIIRMSEADMRAAGASEGELLLVLEAGTGQWWAAQAGFDENLSDRALGVSKEDATFLGLRESSVVDLVKSDGGITDLERAVFALDSAAPGSMAELVSYAHLHGDEMRALLEGQVVGKGTRLWFGGRDTGNSMTLAYTVPSLEPDELARLPERDIGFRPSQMFRHINIVLCVSTGASMGIRDIQLKTLQSTRRRLRPFVSIVPESTEFLSGLGSKSSRIEIATLAAMHTIQNVSTNRNDGEIGIVTISENPSKFSIQKGDTIRTSVQFSTELSSDEVLVSMIYSLLDTVADVGGESNVSGAFRSIVEYLEDFGPEIPTLALVFTTDIEREIDAARPFLQALASKERYQIELFQLGEGSAEIDVAAQLEGIKLRFHSISQFSSDAFEGLLAEAIENLTPTTHDTSRSDEP